MANQTLVIPVGKHKVTLSAVDVRRKEINRDWKFKAQSNDFPFLKVSLPDWEKEPEVFEPEVTYKASATMFWSAMNDLGTVQWADNIQSPMDRQFT